MLPLVGNRCMHVTSDEKSQQPMWHCTSRLVLLCQGTRVAVTYVY